MPTQALKNPTSSISHDVDPDTPGTRPDATTDSGEVSVTLADNDTEAGQGSPEAADGQPDGTQSTRPWRRLMPPDLGLVVGLTMAAALTALVGVLGVQAHHAHRATQLRASYLQVGRQGALNLTTIDWRHADADVQRILDSATGSFYDDFSQRSAPFVEVVKKVRSISTGTVTVAGLESSTANDAQVLVAVNVETTTSETPQPVPRAWRMRISVQKVGNDVKVSNVEFVP